MSGWKSTTLRKYGNRPKIIGDTDVPLGALGGFYCSSIASFGGTPAWTQICTNHQLILKHKPKGSALQAFKGCNWGETSDADEQQEKPKITKHRKIWSCRDRFWGKSYNYAEKLFSVRYLKISTANNFALICDFDIRAVAPSIWNQSFRILLTQSILVLDQTGNMGMKVICSRGAGRHETACILESVGTRQESEAGAGKTQDCRLINFIFHSHGSFTFTGEVRQDWPTSAEWTLTGNVSSFYRTSHSINNSPGLPLLQGNQVQM